MQIIENWVLQFATAYEWCKNDFSFLLCWHGKRKIISKEFYIKCTRLLIKATSLLEFEDIHIDTLTVCYNDIKGRCLSSNTDYSSDISRNKLLNKIKGLPPIPINDEQYLVDDSYLQNEDDYISNDDRRKLHTRR